ncbi:MAG: hypothetical protein MJ168_01425 [Clostridia bacterium]|nr:hypothetical protein [Clostridia bacterium]
MKKRRLERVAVMILSSAMLISSTGIMSSLAATVSESSSAPTSAFSESVSSTTVAQEGGVVAKNDVVEEGGALVQNEKGDGSVENPYQISNAEDFLRMTSKINLTTGSDKYFILTSDIDLSTVTEENFIKNGGSLVGVSKKLAKSSENVFFNLNGNGHKIKGLNVNVTSSSIVSIFGFVNDKSTIKNIIVEKPRITSTSENLVSASTLVYENKGTINNVQITYPVITLAKSKSAAFVASVNDGTISKVTVKASHTNASAASADNHTISAFGSVGAIAGVNRGKIISSSAINIGMFIPTAADSKTVYGGIAGRSSGIISDCVSTGNVFGGKSTDIASGIVGKAETGLKLTNNYTLVTLSNSVSGYAVIGTAGTADMLTDCYWSSDVSRRSVPTADYANNENNLAVSSFKVLPAGKTLKIGKSDTMTTSWSKAVFELDGGYKTKNENITANDNATEMTVKSGKIDSVNTVSYAAKISLPASVGSGAPVKQNMRIYVLNVPADTKGNGTKENPLEIKNTAEFGFLAYATGIHCKLVNNITATSKVNMFRGSIDGCGYTISTKSPLFNTFSGKAENLNIIVNKDISRAVFGNVIGASMSNIGVVLKDGVSFKAESSNSGILADKIIGKSAFDDCRVKGNIVVTSDKITNIGGFAGIAAGEGSIFTNSGAVTNITSAEGVKYKSAVNFIGTVSADKSIFENCYAGGANKAGSYMFIGTADVKSIAVKNICVDYGADKSAAALPVDFNSCGEKIDKNQFTEWKFDNGNTGFFTGNGSKFETTLPSVKAVKNSSASDLSLAYDKTKISASVTVADGKAVLSVSRLNGVVTVKAVPVTVINTKTGLSAVIYVSNGLEKDAKGNWIVSSAFDLAYIGENIEEMNKASFAVSKNIDMSVVDGFTPIGSTGTAFSGTFDGNGHTISNLKINGTAKTALFGTLADATVKNIKLSNASVTSEGGYAAVVAGQATGKTVISGITVEKSNVNVADNYSAIIVASVDNASNVKISDINVKNSAVKSSANYAGAVAGKITDNCSVNNVTVDGFTAVGSNFISGIAGLATGEKSINISNVKVNASDISGVSEISGIASGIGSGAVIKNTEVKSSGLYTLSTDSSFVAGGISAVFGSVIENAVVDTAKITAGIAGGIVGKTSADCALTVKGAKVVSTDVSSDGANTAAAGILAVHNTKGSAVIESGFVDEKTSINGAAVTAGIVGDCSGADSILKIEETKSFADVNGSETANAVSAAGGLGRIGTSAINSVSINGVTVGGSVSGLNTVGGIIGLIKKGESYNSKSPVVSASIAFSRLEVLNPQTQAGMIVGGLESDKVLDSKMLNKAFTNVIVSTYYGSVGVYSQQSELAGGNVIDMDKPNGNPIVASVSKISTYDEVPVSISNLPNVDGFVFDSTTGWISESDERIEVVSSTENSAVLKAKHMADISVVSYYVLDSDAQVRVPVHFEVSSDIRTPLKGNGTKASPYLVSSAYDLETVAQYSSDNAYFVLSEDIVLTPADFEFGGAFYNVGNGFITIGNAENGFKGSFSGLYNGKIHSITGLSLAGNAFGGLFGATDGAEISDIVINKADVSGLNYAGVIVGHAKDTVIKNITINSSEVKATEFGGYAGSVVGYAENTEIENVKINSSAIRTNLDATSATVEIAGGIAGVFNGTVKNIAVNNSSVEAGTLAGGIIGEVRGGKAVINGVSVNADVTADIAGGAVGSVDNILKLSINKCYISGEVNGTETAAGLIGSVNGQTGLDNAKAPVAVDTVITSKISKAETNGILFGAVSEKVVCDKKNVNTKVFNDIYYSSYQNDMSLFGNDKIKAYQYADYDATDLNNIVFVADGAEYDSIVCGADAVVLDADSLKLNGVKGDYKSFTAADKIFKLENVKSVSENALVYNSADSSLRFSSDNVDNATAVLEYNDGLEIAVDVVRGADNKPEAADTTVVTAKIKDKTDGALKDKLIGVSLKTKDNDKVYSADSFIKVNSKTVAAVAGADNGIYISAVLPQNVSYSVTAVDENGNELKTVNAGSEGYFVSAENAESAAVTITAESNSVWGLHAVWGAIGK